MSQTQITIIPILEPLETLTTKIITAAAPPVDLDMRLARGLFPLPWVQMAVAQSEFLHLFAVFGDLKPPMAVYLGLHLKVLPQL